MKLGVIFFTPGLVCVFLVIISATILGRVVQFSSSWWLSSWGKKGRFFNSNLCLMPWRPNFLGLSPDAEMELTSPLWSPCCLALKISIRFGVQGISWLFLVAGNESGWFLQMTGIAACKSSMKEIARQSKASSDLGTTEGSVNLTHCKERKQPSSLTRKLKELI